jgi:hypothetical protein
MTVKYIDLEEGHGLSIVETGEREAHSFYEVMCICGERMVSTTTYTDAVAMAVDISTSKDTTYTRHIGRTYEETTAWNLLNHLGMTHDKSAPKIELGGDIATRVRLSMSDEAILLSASWCPNTGNILSNILMSDRGGNSRCFGVFSPVSNLGYKVIDDSPTVLVLKVREPGVKKAYSGYGHEVYFAAKDPMWHASMQSDQSRLTSRPVTFVRDIASSMPL